MKKLLILLPLLLVGCVGGGYDEESATKTFKMIADSCKGKVETSARLYADGSGYIELICKDTKVER